MLSRLLVNDITDKEMGQLYLDFLKNKDFQCVAARETAARQEVARFIAGNMAGSKDDAAILRFLYCFVDEFKTKTNIFYSTSVIFKLPLIRDEQTFEEMIWQRLQALSQPYE